MAGLELDISQVSKGLDKISKQLEGFEGHLSKISSKPMTIKFSGDFKNTADLLGKITSNIETLTKGKHTINLSLGSSKEISEQIDKLSKATTLKLKIDDSSLKEISNQISKSLSNVKLNFSFDKDSLKSLQATVNSSVKTTTTSKTKVTDKSAVKTGSLIKEKDEIKHIDRLIGTFVRNATQLNKTNLDSNNVSKITHNAENALSNLLGLIPSKSGYTRKLAARDIKKIFTSSDEPLSGANLNYKVRQVLSGYNISGITFNEKNKPVEIAKKITQEIEKAPIAETIQSKLESAKPLDTSKLFFNTKFNPFKNVPVTNAKINDTVITNSKAANKVPDKIDLSALMFNKKANDYTQKFIENVLSGNVSSTGIASQLEKPSLLKKAEQYLASQKANEEKPYAKTRNAILEDLKHLESNTIHRDLTHKESLSDKLTSATAQLRSGLTSIYEKTIKNSVENIKSEVSNVKQKISGKVKGFSESKNDAKKIKDLLSNTNVNSYLNISDLDDLYNSLSKSYGMFTNKHGSNKSIDKLYSSLREKIAQQRYFLSNKPDEHIGYRTKGKGSLLEKAEDYKYKHLEESYLSVSEEKYKAMHNILNNLHSSPLLLEDKRSDFQKMLSSSYLKQINTEKLPFGFLKTPLKNGSKSSLPILPDLDNMTEEIKNVLTGESSEIKESFEEMGAQAAKGFTYPFLDLVDAAVKKVPKKVNEETKKIEKQTKKEAKKTSKQPNKTAGTGIRSLKQDLEDADVEEWLEAREQRYFDPKRWARAQVLIQNKYGERGIKLLNESSSKASYNDATYGKEAREFLNETKALRHSGLGGGRGVLGDLGLISAIRHGNFGYYITDALMGNIESSLKSRKMNSLIRNSKTFQNFIDDYNSMNPNNQIDASNKKQSKEFLKNLRKTDQKQYTKLLSGTMQEDSSAGTKLAKAGASAGIIGAAIAGITLLGKKIIDFSKECIAAAQKVETLKTQLSVVYGSTAEANNSFGKIEEYAKKSPFGVETMTQQAILLKQSGVYGYDLMNTLGRLGDISSGNAEKMRSVSEVYARVLSATTVTARDMRQLANAGVPAYKALTSALNKYGATNPELQGRTITQFQIRSLLQGGKITSQDFRNMIRELTDEGGLFEGAVEKGSKTLAARKQNLEDKKEMAKAAIGAWESGLYKSEVPGQLSFYKRGLEFMESYWENHEKKANRLNNLDASKAFDETQNYIKELDDKIKSLEEKGLFNEANVYKKEKERYVKNLPSEYENKISAEYDLLNEKSSKYNILSDAEYEIKKAQIEQENKLHIKKANDTGYGITGGRLSVPSLTKEWEYALEGLNTISEKEYRKRIKDSEFYKGWSEVSLLEKMTNAFEKFDEVVEDLSSVQQREQKALQEWEKSAFVTRERQIESFNRDVELRRTIDSYDNKYMNKNGSYNFNKGESFSEYNKVIESIAALGSVEKIDTGVSDVFDVKTGKLKVRLDENGNNIVTSNLNELAKNTKEVFTLFDSSIIGEARKNKDNVDLFQAFFDLKIAADVLSNSTDNMEHYTNALAGYNESLDDFKKTIDEKAKKGVLSKEDAEAYTKAVQNSQVKKIYDTTNKKYLGERLSNRAWQNLMANTLGLDAFWLREMTGNRSTNASGFFNKYYKDNMSKKSIYSSLATSLLGTGHSYGDIAGALVKSKNGSYDTTVYDWNASINNLKNVAFSGKAEDVDAYSKSLDGVIKQLDKMAVEGAATSEAWGDIMSSAGALGSAMDMTVEKLKDGSVRFTNATVEAISKYKNELSSQKLDAEITSIIKKLAEKLAEETKHLNLESGVASGSYAGGQYNTANAKKYREESTKLIEEVTKTFKNTDKKVVNEYIKSLPEINVNELQEIIKEANKGVEKKEEKINFKVGGIQSGRAASIYGDKTIGTLLEGLNKWEKATKEEEDFINHLDTVYKRSGFDEAAKEAKEKGYTRINVSNEGRVFAVQKAKQYSESSIENADRLGSLMENPEFADKLLRALGVYEQLQIDINANTEATNANAKALESEDLYLKALSTYDTVTGFNSGLPKDRTLKNRGTDYSNSTIWNTLFEKAVLKNAGLSENLDIDEYWNVIKKKTTKSWDEAVEKITTGDSKGAARVFNDKNNKYLYKRFFGNVDPFSSDFYFSLPRSMRYDSKGKSIKSRDIPELKDFKEALELKEDGTFDYERLANALQSLKQAGVDLSKIDPFHQFKKTEWLNTLSEKLKEFEEGLENAFKQVPSQLLLTTTNQLGKNMYDVAHNSKTAEEANKAMVSAVKGVASSLASQIAQLNTELGLQLAITGAKMMFNPAERAMGTSMLATGLALAGVGGIASVASGYMQASAEDNKESKAAEDRLQRLEALKNNLADLIKQARDDAMYYEKELRNNTSFARNEAISVTKVNDMILTDKGVFSTDPKDTIMAMKNPTDLLGNSKMSPNISVSVINQSGRSLNVTGRSESVDANGNIDVKLFVNSIVQEGIANGDYDDAFGARQMRNQGELVSA